MIKLRTLFTPLAVLAFNLLPASETQAQYFSDIENPEVICFARYNENIIHMDAMENDSTLRSVSLYFNKDNYARVITKYHIPQEENAILFPQKISDSTYISDTPYLGINYMNDHAAYMAGINQNHATCGSPILLSEENAYKLSNSDEGIFSFPSLREPTPFK